MCRNQGGLGGPGGGPEGRPRGGAAGTGDTGPAAGRRSARPGRGRTPGRRWRPRAVAAAVFLRCWYRWAAVWLQPRGEGTGQVHEQRRREVASGWLILADGAALVASYFLALYLRFLGPPPAPNLIAVERSLPLLVLICLALAQIYGLYERRPMGWPEQVQSIFVLVALDTVAAMAGIFFARTFAVPRSVIVIAGALDLLLLFGYRRLVHRAWAAHNGPPRLLLVEPPGGEGRTQPVEGASFRIAAAVVAGCADADALAMVRHAVLEAGADGLLLSQALPGGTKEALALLAVERGWELFIEPRLLDLMVLQSRPSMFGDRLVINLTGAAGSGYHRALKRFIDVSLSLLFLVVTAPVVAAAALAVLLEDGRPVLYRQERVGLGGRRFVVVKIRTMVRDAEAATGPVRASRDDPRTTRVGRWLRALHLDELPQLWNVLRGEMSLVGPRPERPELHDEVVAGMPHFAHRLRVLPGVTGLAQVQGGYDTHPHEKLKFDMLYSLRASAALDAQILLRTVRNVVGTLTERRGRGDAGPRP